MNPATADKLDVQNGDLVTVQTSVGSLTLPVLRYLGAQRDTVAIATGRGQAHAGRYAKAGLNPLELLPLGEDRAGGVVFVSTKANVTKAGGHVLLVTTEGSARQQGRGIGQAIAIADLRAGRPGYDSGNANAAEIAQAGGTETPAGERPEGAAQHGEEMPGDASHAFLPGM